jgi:predicted dehydrogenase
MLGKITKAASNKDSGLGVGVIGANPNRGWGRFAHLPALAALPEYRMAAVCTTKLETAELTARAYNVPHAFADPKELILHPAVDVVAITVKAPCHHELADAALKAGKSVYCEWPMAHGLAQAESMATAARAAGLTAAVGLQGRSSPGVNQVRDLLANGFVGRILSSSIIASGEHYLDVMPQELEVLLHPQFGTHLLTVHFGHLADVFCWCLGEFAELSASFATRRREVKIAERNEWVAAEAPDHIAVSGTLESGATATIHLRGGHSRASALVWEINGTEGDLLISATHGNIHIAQLTVHGGRGDDVGVRTLPDETQKRWTGAGAPPEGPALNVANAYAKLAQDINTGSRSCPTFQDGLTRHRMLEAVVKAAQSGQRQTYRRADE